MAAAAWVGACDTARAQGFVISNGQTVTGQQTLNDGETGIVEPGGEIDNSGAPGAGVFAGDDIRLDNGGVITGFFDGVFTGDRAEVVNSGTITGVVFSGVDLGADSRLTNTGVVEGFGDGVVLFGSGVVINQGSIVGRTGDGVDGDNGGEQIVVNSGLIASFGGGLDENSVDLGDGDDVLLLLPGSRLIGPVEFGDGVDTLEIGGGLNAVIALDDYTGGVGVFLPERVVLNGLPGVFSSDEQTFATVDPTAFLALEDQLADLTRAISRALRNRRAGIGVDPTAAALLRAAGLSVASSDLTVASAPETGVARTGPLWAQGFAGARLRDRDDVLNETESHWFGAVAGLDLIEASGWRGGAFVGAAGGETAAQVPSDTDVHTIDQTGPFVGLYIGRAAGSVALDLSVATGVSFYDSNRTVAGPSGNQTATADFTGIWVAPEVVASLSVPLTERVAFTPSAGLGYAGLFLEDYTETGSTANLTAEERSVHLLRGRVDLALDWVEPLDGGGHLRAQPRLGIDGYASSGDADGRLLGQAISLDVGEDDAQGVAFAGVTVAYQATNGVSAYVDVEGGYGLDNERSLAASAGFKITLN